MALLWLRLALFALIFRETNVLWHDGELIPLSIGMTLASLGLVSGLLTPVASLLGAIFTLLFYHSGKVQGRLVPFLAISILIALIALGPGAYSLDALIFGRKKLRIGSPPHP